MHSPLLPLFDAQYPFLRDKHDTLFLGELLNLSVFFKILLTLVLDIMV